VNDRDLRGWLARQLKKSSVHEDLWQDLVDMGYVADASAVDGRANLVREAKRVLRLHRSLSGYKTPPGRMVSKRVAADLTDYEAERSLAISEYLAKRAAATPAVRRFRQRFLAGHTLSDAEADAFLLSPALASFSPQQSEQWGIPYVGHTATVTNAEHEAVGIRSAGYVSIYVAPPGTTVAAVRHPGIHQLLPVTSPRSEGTVDIWYGSVLAELRRLAADLERSLGWPAGQAAWFVLTNTPIHVLPIGIGYEIVLSSPRTHGRITLEVEPWVPASSVLRAYRHVQQALLSGDNRPIGSRHLALFSFVAEWETGGKRPRWRELLTAWNHAHQGRPEWRYPAVEGVEKRLARDYERVVRLLLHPQYRAP